ncbi:hypothetical protein [Draconibacterium sp.]|uniref:hypothetical protein n=1 Tax=Draconibacterium sp. TaxID=1965318 RepID=UPI0035669189
MKPLHYILVFAAVIAYLWKMGKDELSKEDKEPDNFKHAVKRGMFEVMESLVGIYQELAPEKEDVTNADEYSSFSGVRPPARLTYDPNPNESRFANLGEKMKRGRFVKIDEKVALAERQAEATERINNLY